MDLRRGRFVWTVLAGSLVLTVVGGFVPATVHAQAPPPEVACALGLSEEVLRELIPGADLQRFRLEKDTAAGTFRACAVGLTLPVGPVELRRVGASLAAEVIPSADPSYAYLEFKQVPADLAAGTREWGVHVDRGEESDPVAHLVVTVAEKPLAVELDDAGKPKLSVWYAGQYVDMNHWHDQRSADGAAVVTPNDASSTLFVEMSPFWEIPKALSAIARGFKASTSEYAHEPEDEISDAHAREYERQLRDGWHFEVSTKTWAPNIAEMHFLGNQWSSGITVLSDLSQFKFAAMRAEPGPLALSVALADGDGLVWFQEQVTVALQARAESLPIPIAGALAVECPNRKKRGKDEARNGETKGVYGHAFDSGQCKLTYNPYLLEHRKVADLARSTAATKAATEAFDETKDRRDGSTESPFESICKKVPPPPSPLPIKADAMMLARLEREARAAARALEECNGNQGACAPEADPPFLAVSQAGLTPDEVKKRLAKVESEASAACGQLKAAEGSYKTVGTAKLEAARQLDRVLQAHEAEEHDLREELRLLGRQELIVTVSRPGATARSVAWVIDDPTAAASVAIAPLDATKASGPYTVEARIGASPPGVIYRRGPASVERPDDLLIDLDDLRFQAHLRPWGLGAIGQAVRVFLTVPFDAVAVRFPARPSELPNSSTDTEVQLVAPRVGLAFVVEPWNFDTGRNSWQVPLRFQAGSYLFSTEKAFDPALFAGIKLALPLLDLPDGIAKDQINTDLAVVGFFVEKPLQHDGVHFLVTTGLDILSLLGTK